MLAYCSDRVEKINRLRYDRGVMIEAGEPSLVEPEGPRSGAGSRSYYHVLISLTHLALHN